MSLYLARYYSEHGRVVTEKIIDADNDRLALIFASRGRRGAPRIVVWKLSLTLTASMNVNIAELAALAPASSAP